METNKINKTTKKWKQVCSCHYSIFYVDFNLLFAVGGSTQTTTRSMGVNADIFLTCFAHYDLLKTAGHFTIKPLRFCAARVGFRNPTTNVFVLPSTT